MFKQIRFFFCTCLTVYYNITVVDVVDNWAQQLCQRYLVGIGWQ